MRAIDGDQFIPDAFYRVPYYAIENAPTLDAVPVVRCRDCKYLYTDEYGFLACAESGAMLNPEENDFCSYGQRRDQSADVRNMGQVAAPRKNRRPK